MLQGKYIFYLLNLSCIRDDIAYPPHPSPKVRLEGEGIKPNQILSPSLISGAKKEKITEWKFFALDA